MKFLTTLFIITLTIIDGIQNAPAIHPIHVHTIPLRPVTPQPTESSERWSDSTQVTDLTSSPSSSSSTPHGHSSWSSSGYSASLIIFRICLYALVITLISKFLEKACKSKKQVKPCKKQCPVVLKNKMCISTIDGQREESPPAYVEIHKI